MNIQKLDMQHLRLIENFISQYKWARQTMQLQDANPRKSKTFEKCLIEVHEWLTEKLTPHQANTLNQMGRIEVIEEMEHFIERWQYETKPILIS